MKIFRICALIAGCFGLPSFAQDCVGLPDFGDLEGLPVYQGTCLIGASDSDFERHGVIVGKMNGRQLGDLRALEGQFSRRVYLAGEGVQPVDIVENYRNGLTAFGFVEVFSCAKRDCGSPNSLLGKLGVYPPDRRLKNVKAISDQAFGNFGDEAYLVMEDVAKGKTIAIYAAFNDTKIFKQLSERSAVLVEVMTAKALENRMIDAAAMAAGITAEGHVAIDNVYFEFGTATLTPEAEPALAEMAKLMAQEPELEVYIVGHTDGVGGYEANLALSQARAAAVVANLEARGIAAGRMVPAGVGPLAPVASNADDAGRQQNRRVELVER